MKTELIYSKLSTQTRDVARATARETLRGMVLLAFVIEGGRELHLTMTPEEARDLAHELLSPSPRPAPPPAYSNWAVTQLETEHGTATLRKIGPGRYAVADGFAVVARQPRCNTWIIEGENKRYPSRYAAVTEVMANL